MGKLIMNTTIPEKKVKKQSNKEMLKSKIVDSVQIMGQDIKIEIKSLKDLYGQFSADKMTISLHDKYDLDTTIQTLIHEMLHAMFAISGHSELFLDNQEEANIRMLELALRPFIDESKLLKP